MDAELEELRAEAEAAGIDVDRRWGKDRLRREIDVAGPEPEVAREFGEQAEDGNGPEPEAEPISELEAWQAAERGEHHPPAADIAIVEEEPALQAALADEEPEPDEQPEPVHRAGGHVDFGDGRGWMPEQVEE